MNNYLETYNFASALVREARDLLLQEKKSGFSQEAKRGDVRDIVTSVDLAVNDFLIKRITQQYPEHAIYSEEGSDNEQTHEFQWLVDPIDGTSHFARGRSLYSISLGLLHEGRPVINIVLHVETNQEFAWYEEGPVTRDGQQMDVSAVADLVGAHVAFRSGRKLELAPWGGESYTKLIREKVKVYNFGSSALDFSYVATGALDGAVYGSVTTQDIAGSLEMIRQAGGYVCNSEGGPVEIHTTPQKVYAGSSEELVEKLRTLLEG